MLTGFMGAGKSTLGPLLAVNLGWAFADLDTQLVEAEQATVTELFARVGEAGFRSMEAEMLARLMLKRRTVIALGGGALDGEATRSLLHQAANTHIIYLETPLEVALARCLADRGAAERPLLAERAGLTARYAARQAEYRRAHQTVSTSPGEPEQIVRTILRTLPSLGRGAQGA